jgi:hypothetical protein
MATFESYLSEKDNSYAVTSSIMMGQTFTVLTKNHTITSILSILHRYGDAGTVYASIYSVSDGIPAVELLKSNGISSSTITTNTEGESIIFNFSSPIIVLKETQYAIVITTTAGDLNNYIKWRCDASAPSYSGGMSQTNSGGGWSSISVADMMFEIYGEFLDGLFFCMG